MMLADQDRAEVAHDLARMAQKPRRIVSVEIDEQSAGLLAFLAAFGAITFDLRGPAVARVLALLREMGRPLGSHDAAMRKYANYYQLLKERADHADH